VALLNRQSFVKGNKMNFNSAQEIYDYVCDFLIKQGKQSLLPVKGLKCAYRGPDGTKCAAGCIIPDDYYDPYMEKKSIHEVADRFPLPEYIRKNMDLINSLQKCHDDPNTWMNENKLKNRLSRIGINYLLDTSKLEIVIDIDS
jgi:hypothetical protein